MDELKIIRFVLEVLGRIKYLTSKLQKKTVGKAREARFFLTSNAVGSDL